MTANVSSNLASWSTTESSNSPAGTDTSDIDAEFRMIQSVVRKYLATKGADIASASTVDLSSATGNYVHITGVTTITALGTVSAGMRFLLVFDGALTFTHNATSLILPGAANITTAAGDRCEMVSLGSGNWRCLWYQPTSGYQPKDATLTALASSLTAANKIPYATALNTLGELTRSTDGTLAGNSDTNIPTEKAVKTYADGTKSFANPGYQILPSGLILQWGSGSTNASGLLVTTLPIEFPTAALSGQACLYNPSAGAYVFINIALSTTQSVVECRDSGGVVANNTPVSWLAIGY